MKYIQTEAEILNKDEQLVNSLFQLYKSNRAQFSELCKLAPFGVRINKVESLDMIMANSKMQMWLELDEPEIVSRGFAHICSIYNQAILRQNIEKARHYYQSQDYNSVCLCPQNLFIRGRFQWMFTYKRYLDEEFFINVDYLLPQFGVVGAFIEDTLGPCLSEENWLKYKHLTKTELLVLRALEDGHSSYEIANKHCVSKHTIDTHRRNILRKIDVKNTSQAIKFMSGFKLFEGE